MQQCERGLTGNASMDGAMVHTMVVRQLPPSESSRMRVSFESRYGMCVRSPRGSVSAAITLPGTRNGGVNEDGPRRRHTNA